MAKPGNQQLRTRCAIYTRKSSDEGLEQAFNSLHAQRESCEAFITSQRHEGWSFVTTPYDDGGYSGGTLERPALQALLADIKAGIVDVVVVYKIDRLTRSLFDFAKIVEIFDGHGVSFVSVTQAFNTTTSMGRLTLNVLLSFAQFEREVTGERIRDKIAASKKKGMWMGGLVPLGYDLKDRKLVINAEESKIVGKIFGLYTTLGAVSRVKTELDRLGIKTKVRSFGLNRTTGGQPFRMGHLYAILANPLYIGLVRHKGQTYPGDHPAIVDGEVWNKIQAQLAANAATHRSGTSAREPSLLSGLLFDGRGHRMTPSHAVKHGKRYRYYQSNNLVVGEDRGRGPKTGDGLRIPAHEIENHVVKAICRFLTDHQRFIAEICPHDTAPSLIGGFVRAAHTLYGELAGDNIGDRHQTIRGLVERISVDYDCIRVVLGRPSLKQRLGIPAAASDQDADLSITLHIPAELRRLGKEKRLIVEAHLPKTNPDPVLIKAITRAHSWFEMLKTRKFESVVEIAKNENIRRTYPSLVITLAFLAPDITEAILDGRQPIDLTLDRILKKLMPLPLDWNVQRRALGFSAG